MTMTHEERKKSLAIAQQRDMLEVADSLGMKLIRQGNTYIWSDHDSLVITPSKNMFYWNSRQKGGGVIQLVEAVKECSHKEAVAYLNQVELGEFVEKPLIKKDFVYYVQEQKDMTKTYDYLINERQLSKETVDFFVSKNLIAQGLYRDKEKEHEETAIVFKHYDAKNDIKGIAYQGVEPFPEIHEPRDYLKRTYGDGFYGLTIPIGHIPQGNDISEDSPLKIIALEAPIDLLSYYELNKETLTDVVLISMNGLRKGTLSTYIANALGSNIAESKKSSLLDDMQKMAKKKTNMIQLTLAVDNDKAGKKFVEDFSVDFIKVNAELPPLSKGRDKADWNDILKGKSEPAMENEKTSELVAPKKEQVEKNQFNYLVSFDNHLTDSLNQLQSNDEPTNNYLTESDVKELLSAHLDKVEHLVKNYEESFDFLTEASREQAEVLKKGLLSTIEEVSSQYKQELGIAVRKERQNPIRFTANRVAMLRSNISNYFTGQILKINQSIQRLVTKIDKKFNQENQVNEELKQDVAPKVVTPEETEFAKEQAEKEELITLGRDYIELQEEIKKLTDNISSTILDNPLSDVSDMQIQIKSHQAKSQAIKERIEQIRSPFNPEQTVNSKMDMATKLAILVGHRDNLIVERDQWVNHPDFLNEKTGDKQLNSPLERFKETDGKVKQLDQLITDLQKGKNVEDNFILNAVQGKEEQKNDIEKKSSSKNKSRNKEATTDKSQAMTDKFQSKKEHLLNEDNLKGYLNSATQFHSYSPKNVELIKEQAPDATQVASEAKWKQLGYELKDNAQAIEVYAPSNEKGDVSFHLTPVYDISQTTAEGKFQPVTFNLQDSQQVPLIMKGLTNEVTNTDLIQNVFLKTTNQPFTESVTEFIDLAVQQTLKTSSVGQQKQFEINAISYMVANHLGVANKDNYSLKDVSQFNGSPYSIKEFNQSLSTISKTANQLISSVEKEMKPLSKNKFEQRIAEGTKKNNEIARQQPERTQEKNTSRSL